MESIIESVFTDNRLLFKSGFINYWILGSVKIVLKTPFPDAILVEY